MNRITITSILYMAVLSLTVGCYAKVSLDGEGKATMGSHKVVIKSHISDHLDELMATPDNERMTSSFDGDTFQCYDVTVKIENEVLIVNEISYGSLEAGQSIEIDNGKVFVADQERAPAKQD